MRSLKDRVILILETIIGKEELALLLENEEVAILKGSFYNSDKQEMVKSISFGYNDKSITDTNHSKGVTSFSNAFNQPLSSIENDESKYLQVYINWKYKSLDKKDFFKEHNFFVDLNEQILLPVYKMFEKDSIFELRYDFEEFGGVATRFYKFGFRTREGRVKFKFISSCFNLVEDPYFWTSLSDFIGSRYAVYVSADMLKEDYSNIIDSLPQQIPWEEFEKRYSDPEYGK